MLFFVFCSNETNNYDSENLIDLNQLSQVSIFDLFESIDVVQLETNDNSLISTITKVIFSNDRYYIYDARQQMLFCFDSSGKFLFKIDRKGQGPDEYLHLGDFNVDSFNNQLLLLEPFGHLLVFDLDGHFAEKIRLPKEIKAYNLVYPLDKDNLVFISLNEYYMVLYSRIKNEIIDKRYKIDMELRSLFSIPRKTYIYNDNVFFSKPPLTNDIVNLSNDTEFSWNFGKDNNTENQINKLKKMVISEDDRGERDYVGEGRVNYMIYINHESSRYKICVLDCGKFKFKYVFYDKILKKPIVFEKTKENIFLILANFYGEHIIMHEGRLSPNKNDPRVTDSLITEITSYYSRDILTNEQKKIIDSHNEEDNPFLIKYNMKQ